MPGPILDHTDPGLYRRARGIRGDDPRMLPEGQRIPSTTGEAKLPAHSGSPALARTALDPHSVGFAVLVLMALLFVIHARFAVATKASIGTR